jgi:hypothetical protein
MLDSKALKCEYNLRALDEILRFWNFLETDIIKVVGMSQSCDLYAYLDKDDFFLNIKSDNRYKLDTEKKLCKENSILLDTCLNFDINIVIVIKEKFSFNVDDCNYYYAESNGIDDFDYDIDHGTIYMSGQVNVCIREISELKCHVCFNLIRELQYAYNRIFKNISLLKEENFEYLEFDAKLSQIFLIKKITNMDTFSALEAYKKELNLSSKEISVIEHLVKEGKL